MRLYRSQRVSGCAALLLLAACPIYAEWTALGPFGGSAAVVATDPHHPMTVLVGTSNALLFRSVDAGESWTPLRFPAQLQAVLHALAIDPLTPGIYLAGLSSDLPQYSGMLRSSDDGATWQQVPAFRGLQVRTIAFFRGNSQIVAVGTDRGVFRSRDEGLAWDRISPEDNPNLEPIVSLAFDPNDSAVLYAGTPHLPWKTEDDGLTWRPVYAGMLDDSDIFSIIVDRNRSKHVLAAACSGLYQSLSGGDTWTRGMRDASVRTYVTAQDPQYENVLFAGSTVGLIRSVDGGRTWRKLLAYSTRSIAFDLGHLGRIFIATDDRGVLRSEDGGKSWQSANRGFCNRRLAPLPAAGGELYVGRLVGFDENPESQWRKIPIKAPLSPVRLIASATSSDPARSRFAATPEAIFVSADAGAEWTSAPRPAPQSPLTGLAVPPWAPHMLVVSTASQVFFSEDVGTTWQRANLPPVTGEIRKLAALQPWLLAIGPSAILLSLDGRDWNAIKLPRGAEIYDVIPSGKSGLIAATSTGLRISHDLGASWAPAPGILEGNTVQALTRHPVRSLLLFAAQYGVVYSSKDGARSWTRISPEDWPISSVKQLLVAPGVPDRLLVVTLQQGVFAIQLTTVTGSAPGNL